MLCLPGLTPVAKLAQATGDSDGCVVSSFENTPESASFFRFGSFPSSMYFRTSVGSMPSKPMMATRSFARRSGLPGGPEEQAVPDAIAASRQREERARVVAIGTSCEASRRPRIVAASRILSDGFRTPVGAAALQGLAGAGDAPANR